MIDHEYYADPEEILGWAIALIRNSSVIGNESIVARDGSVNDENAFVEFRIEFPKSSRLDRIARRVHYEAVDRQRVVFPATIFKGNGTNTLQPDSANEWNENLGRFSDCDRVLVTISKNI